MPPAVHSQFIAEADEMSRPLASLNLAVELMGLDIREWQVTETDHTIGKDPEGPDVAIYGVPLFPLALWGHILQELAPLCHHVVVALVDHAYTNHSKVLLFYRQKTCIYTGVRN